MRHYAVGQRPSRPMQPDSSGVWISPSIPADRTTERPNGAKRTALLKTFTNRKAPGSTCSPGRSFPPTYDKN